MGTLLVLGSSAVPALPGAQKMRSTLGDWANFQTRACSRPPLPNTSSFMHDSAALSGIWAATFGKCIVAGLTGNLVGGDRRRTSDSFRFKHWQLVSRHD